MRTSSVKGVIQNLKSVGHKAQFGPLRAVLGTLLFAASQVRLLSGPSRKRYNHFSSGVKALDMQQMRVSALHRQLSLADMPARHRPVSPLSDRHELRESAGG